MGYQIGTPQHEAIGFCHSTRKNQAARSCVRGRWALKFQGTLLRTMISTKDTYFSAMLAPPLDDLLSNRPAPQEAAVQLATMTLYSTEQTSFDENVTKTYELYHDIHHRTPPDLHPPICPRTPRTPSQTRSTPRRRFRTTLANLARRQTLARHLRCESSLLEQDSSIWRLEDQCDLQQL